MAFVGIERAVSGVRMLTVVPRLMRCVSGWVACDESIGPDESFDEQKVNDDNDDDHFDRLRF